MKFTGFKSPHRISPSLFLWAGLLLAIVCAPAQVALVPAGATWRFLDTGVDLGTAWRAAAFNDTGWFSGPAELGYGDGDEQQIVSFGTNANNKFITTYFRHTFVVSNRASISNVAVRLRRDDGGVAYLNGTEIFRSNLPEGTVLHSTPSLEVASNADEDQFFPAAIPPALLLPGTNVLAVEVHQSDGASSDLSFNLELLGNTPLGNRAPAVTISAPAPLANLVTNQPFTLAASATDDDGGVSSLEIYEDGALIHTKVGASTTFVRTNATSGLRTYFARAIDGLGVAGTSAPVSVFFSATNARTLLFPRFVDTNGLILKGHAKLKPYALRVCPATNGPGAMWLTNRQNIRAGFENTFTFQLLNQGNGGGDGIALLIQGAVTPALGNNGGGIGYSGVTNSVAVELDTWGNPEAADPSSRHMSVHSRGRAANSEHHDHSLAANSAVPQFTDGGVHSLRVRYFPGRFEAFIDDFFTPVISLPLDLNEHLYLENGLAWIGITGAVGFGIQDHDIRSWSVTTFTNQLPAVSLITPTNETLVTPGGAFLLQATATDSDGAITRVEYFSGTNSLGFATAPPYAVLWTNIPAGLHFIRARATDDRLGSTGSVTVRVYAATPERLVTSQSSWRYLDNGTDPGTNWAQRSFNDSAWASGPAELGYGDGDELTVVNGGPANNRYVTTYFRRTFQVTNHAVFTNLSVAVVRDDAAAVYLNGVEILRDNLPEGRITNRTFAVNVINTEAEAAWVRAPVPPGLLQTGTNVIAVEIHQYDITSTDISFDLELLANSPFGNFPPQLVFTQPSTRHRFAAGANLLLNVSAGDPDGAMGPVTFHAGDAALGTITNAPFTLVWSNAPFGLHRLTAHATDDQEVTGTSAPVFIAVGPATVPFASNLGLATNLILLQDALLISNALRLTTNTANRTGAAYLNTKQNVAWGFESVFEFHISALGGMGGEGLAFVIQNNASPLPGTGGANLGYAGVSNSLAIEIDTRSSTANPYNELSIQTRGTLPNDSANPYALDRTTGLPNLTGTGPHVLRVLYTPGWLQVFLDGAAVPAVSAAVDLAQLFPLDNGRAWVGFTASTAADTETHDVRWWYFHGLAAPAAPLLNQVQPQPDGTVQLDFSSQAGHRYQWQYSHDLEQWFDVPPVLIGTDGPLPWRDEGPPATPRPPSEEPHRFYRVQMIQ